MGSSMRILFVSGTMTGGAARSTHELARRLHVRDHDVGVLVRRKPARRLDPSATSVGGFRAPVSKISRGLMRRMTARPLPLGDEPYPVWVTAFIESAAPAVLRDHRPDVVVVN